MQQIFWRTPMPKGDSAWVFSYNIAAYFSYNIAAYFQNTFS